MPQPYDRDKPVLSSSGYRVMVAEDSQVLFKVIKSQLQKLGIGVDYADNGFEAVRLYQTEKVAAILMDGQMPIMDGYEAAGIIRALEEKGTGHIPIIAMTAASSPDARDKCLAAGMDDYLTKPFSLESLAQTLTKWIPELQEKINLPSGAQVTPLPPPAQDNLVIDLDQLRTYVGDDEEVKQYVISDYLKNSHERMEALRQALKAKNSPETKRLAHAFKAVNAFIGARTMVNILGEMEECAVKEDFVQEGRLFVSLVKNHDQVYQALSKLRK